MWRKISRFVKSTDTDNFCEKWVKCTNTLTTKILTLTFRQFLQFRVMA